MSSIKLKGSTSGEITVRAPAEAGDTVLDLPVGSGHIYHSASPPGLREIVTFTSSGTFTKADYPWLRAIRVRLVGAGGGGGGTTGGSNGSAAGGGGGGAYAESVIEVDSLSTSESVTVGSGGSGGSSAPSNGSSGGSSSFGSHVSADGGGAGTLSGNFTNVARVGGSGGAGGTGQIVIPGGSAGFSRVANGTMTSMGMGGSSCLGHGGSPLGLNIDGNNGRLYGGGASSTASHADSHAGGSGANGVVIIELYG